VYARVYKAEYMLNKVKKAKKLKEQGVKIKDMEDDVGIARAYIPKLLELYDAMTEKEDVPVVNNPDYVVIRKQKYIRLSILIQNKIAETRKEFLEMQKIIRREKDKLFNAKYAYGNVKDLADELNNTALVLNVTSRNLQHAEDGYEYLKREVKYNYIFWFLVGVTFTFTVLGTARNIFGINL